MEDRVKKILCVLMVLGVAPCFFVEAMQRQAVRVQESRTASGVSRTSSISGPRLVNFNGTLRDANGLPLTGIVGVTFSLYANEQGGAPLWMENQNVQLDEQGNYAVLLGSTGSGIPVELFASGEPRWLGVQSQSQDAQSRILLNGRAPLPEDWTDHTVVFSKPADPQKAFQLSQDPRYAKQWNGRNRAGSTNPSAANLRAAINLDSTQCGSGPPCFGSLTAANANVTAPSVSTNAVSLTAKCAGTAYNVAISDSTSNITETGMSGGTNGSTSGANFAISTTASTDATNLTTAINANAGTGVIATSSGGIVTLAASTPGSAGNSISLTQTFTSGFGWSGGTLGGGSDTNGCTSATVGNFVNSSTVGTAAANLRDAINSCNGSFPAVGATSTATAGVTTITATTPGTDIASGRG